MAVSPMSMIILIAQYLILIAFIFSGIMFARGKSSEGWNWFKNAIILALALIIIPGAVSFIFTGNSNPTNAIDNLQVPNYYIDLDTGVPAASNVIVNASTDTKYVYSYNMQMDTAFHVAALNFGVTGTTSETIIVGNGDYEFEIPNAATPIIVYKGANKINNSQVESNLNKTITIKSFIEDHKIVEIKYSPDGHIKAGTVTEYIGYILSGTTHTVQTYTFEIVVGATPVHVQGGGGGLSGAIASALAKLVNIIIDGFKWLGAKAVSAMPAIDGRRAMIMFVFMPTENMLSSNATYIHDFYYSKAIPIGMTLLVMTTILAFIEQLWAGSGDALFSVMKKFTGIIIWMVGGYYFYMAFAEFVDAIILSVGIHGLLWFGGLINSLFGMIIILGIATMLVSNNVSGTALGMLLGILYLFFAMAVFRFFFIAAAVAMFPIIAPFSMISYGPSMHGVISKFVEQGVMGIMITVAIEFLRLSQNAGGIIGSVASIITVYILFSPQQVHSFLGGMVQGGHMDIGSSMSIAGGALGATKTLGRVTAAGVGETGVGAYAKTKQASLTGKRQTAGIKSVSIASRQKPIGTTNAGSKTKSITPVSKTTVNNTTKTTENTTSGSTKTMTMTEGKSSIKENAEKLAETGMAIGAGMKLAQEATKEENKEKTISTAEAPEEEQVTSMTEAEETEKEEVTGLKSTKGIEQTISKYKEMPVEGGAPIRHPSADDNIVELTKEIDNISTSGLIEAAVIRKNLGEKKAEEYRSRLRNTHSGLRRLQQISRSFDYHAGVRSSAPSITYSLRRTYLNEMASMYDKVAKEADEDLKGLIDDLHIMKKKIVEDAKINDEILNKSIQEAGGSAKVNFAGEIEKNFDEFIKELETTIDNLDKNYSEFFKKHKNLLDEYEKQLKEEIRISHDGSVGSALHLSRSKIKEIREKLKSQYGD